MEISDPSATSSPRGRALADYLASGQSSSPSKANEIADENEAEDALAEQIENWSDDPVRMYLTQMGEIPLLTRAQEIYLARQIETTRAQFRAKLLECEYVCLNAFKVLSRVHKGELPFDRTVQVSVTDRLEKEQILATVITTELDNQIKQEQTYRERLMKGEEERIKQLKRVNELREEERKLMEERHSKIAGSLVDQQKLKDEEEQRLKAEEQRLKEEKINSKEAKELDDRQEKRRLNGTVKWFNVSKGYGFIKREDKEKDVFVHSSAVENSGLKYLKKDEQLTFEVESSDKGPSAVNLQKITAEVFRSHLKVVK